MWRVVAGESLNCTSAALAVDIGHITLQSERWCFLNTYA